jgi:FemAB-related protein (PEP-CTERM system-associated)
MVAPEADRPRSATALRVREMDERDALAWDRWVTAHPQGTFFHLSGWRTVIREALGHRVHYLLAERDGALEGVLPLAETRSLLFGHALVSTPLCVYGGVIASTAEAAAALHAAATQRARDLGVDHLELRNREVANPDWPRKPLYVRFRKELQPESEKNLQAIPRKQRAMVRKGITAGLVAEQDSSSARLYALYCESVRNLGTPVFSRGVLDWLLKIFPTQTEIRTILHEHTPVASVMSFYFRDEVLPYYGGGSLAARSCAANDFMYWSLMEHAVTRGVRTFDFGRSKVGSGSYRFKAHWGFEPQELQYEYFLVRSEKVPDADPTNPKYRLPILVWRHLPLGITRFLGPPIARHLL